MRYADRVTFFREVGHYDPDLSRYVEGQPEKKTLPCNLSFLGIDRQRELFGRIDRTTAVVRLQRPYSREFDYAEINGKRYELLRVTPLRSETAYYFEEVPHEAQRYESAAQ